MYFDSNDITVPLIVLGIYAVVGSAFVTIFSWRPTWLGKREPDGTGSPEVIDADEQIGVAAIPPG